MRSLGKIFFTGMFVSFLGSLPLGTLNIAAMQISITDGIRPALLFSLGSLLVEVIYVRLSLVAMDWVRRQEKLFRILEWVTLLIIVALAISSFHAALSPSENKNVILSSTLHRFWLGAIMCAVNPVQIPFWFGWSTVLFTKKILLPRQDHYYSYITGIGIGTFFGNCVFIFGGLFIADKLKSSQNLLSWIIGGIFAMTAIIQIWRMKKNKTMVSKMDHPEEITHGMEDKIVE
ncbi:MAG TPA: LysE family transporter [Chitinophagaceae bacterium]